MRIKPRDTTYHKDLSCLSGKPLSIHHFLRFHLFRFALSKEFLEHGRLQYQTFLVPYLFFTIRSLGFVDRFTGPIHRAKTAFTKFMKKLISRYFHLEDFLYCSETWKKSPCRTPLSEKKPLTLSFLLLAIYWTLADNFGSRVVLRFAGLFNKTIKTRIAQNRPTCWA